MNVEFLPENQRKDGVLVQNCAFSLGIQVGNKGVAGPESQLLFAFEKKAPAPLIFEMKKAEIVKVCVCPLKGKDLLPFSNGAIISKRVVYCRKRREFPFLVKVVIWEMSPAPQVCMLG